MLYDKNSAQYYVNGRGMHLKEVEQLIETIRKIMPEQIDIGVCAPVSMLSETVDKYLAIRGIEKKKHYSKYLIIAGEIWKDIFQKTLFSTKSVWKELKDGDPYPYVDIPRDNSRLLSCWHNRLMWKYSAALL
jgi:hypothetical protein